jgi:hypothetical protein
VELWSLEILQPGSLGLFWGVGAQAVMMLRKVYFARCA